ncbi:MAG: hypothetical protein QXN75_03415 [Thermoproteota archaeon]
MAGAVLILFSGILLGIIAILLGVIISFTRWIPIIGLLFEFFGEELTSLGIWLIIVTSIIGVLIIIGAVMILSKSKSRVIKGSILVIALSIIAVFFIGGCFSPMGIASLETLFYVGILLEMIGGTLGLLWRPSDPSPPPPPP